MDARTTLPWGMRQNALGAMSSARTSIPVDRLQHIACHHRRPRRSQPHVRHGLVIDRHGIDGRRDVEPTGGRRLLALRARRLSRTRSGGGSHRDVVEGTGKPHAKKRRISLHHIFCYTYPYPRYGGAGLVADGLMGVLYNDIATRCTIVHPDREGVKDTNDERERTRAGRRGPALDR